MADLGLSLHVPSSVVSLRLERSDLLVRFPIHEVMDDIIQVLHHQEAILQTHRRDLYSLYYSGRVGGTTFSSCFIHSGEIFHVLDKECDCKHKDECIRR